MKNIFKILLLSVWILIAVSCDVGRKNVLRTITIKDGEIFDVTPAPEGDGGDSYYIYFYSGVFKKECAPATAEIVSYLKKYEENKELPYVWAVDVRPSDKETSFLFRPFKGYPHGQGKNGYFLVDGLTNRPDKEGETWKSKLCIASSPSLIEIHITVETDEKGNREEIRKAEFTAQGAEEIGRKLSKRSEKDKRSKVFFDPAGGIMEGKSVLFLTDDDKLPIPKREDYIFIGWMEKGEFTEKISGSAKEHMLKAVWVKETIPDSEIFNQKEKEYLVYAKKDGCPPCNKINDDILRYVVEAEKRNKLSLYTVNIHSEKYKSKISRQYQEDGGDGDGFYVSGVSSWEDLYICSTPSLFKIVTGGEGEERKAELLATGASNIQEKLKEYLKDEEDRSKELAPFTILYDDGSGREPEKKEYYWNDFLLPIPKKEGFVFLGWYENDEKITSPERRDYHLVARWEKDKEKS